MTCASIWNTLLRFGRDRKGTLSLGSAGKTAGVGHHDWAADISHEAAAFPFDSHRAAYEGKLKDSIHEADYFDFSSLLATCLNHDCGRRSPKWPWDLRLEENSPRPLRGRIICPPVFQGDSSELLAERARPVSKPARAKFLAPIANVYFTSGIFSCYRPLHVSYRGPPIPIPTCFLEIANLFRTPFKPLFYERLEPD